MSSSTSSTQSFFTRTLDDDDDEFFLMTTTTNSKIWQVIISFITIWIRIIIYLFFLFRLVKIVRNFGDELVPTLTTHNSKHDVSWKNTQYFLRGFPFVSRTTIMNDDEQFTSSDQRNNRGGGGETCSDD